jgi:hypothetical protein
MRHRVLAIFTTWPFVLSLAALLINDQLLKQAYPGLITGKLSDFAGLAVVSMPLFAAFPRRARTIYLALAGAFLWWKSPASAGFIAFLNGVQPLNIGRTVDYWDLVALAILPPCAKFAAAVGRRQWNPSRLRRFALPPILAVALLGVMGTSIPALRRDFTVRTIESSNQLPHDGVVKAIKDVALEHGLKPSAGNPPHWEGAFAGKGIYMTYSFPTPNQVAVEMSVQLGTFAGTHKRKAEALRDDIKKTLALRFQGLEYIEALRDR